MPLIERPWLHGPSLPSARTLGDWLLGLPGVTEVVCSLIQADRPAAGVGHWVGIGHRLACWVKDGPQFQLVLVGLQSIAQCQALRTMLVAKRGSSHPQGGDALMDEGLLIDRPFRSIEGFTNRLESSAVVMSAIVTTRVFRLPPGPRLRLAAPGNEHQIEAFFDTGQRHQLIQVTLMPGQDPTQALPQLAKDLARRFRRPVAPTAEPEEVPASPTPEATPSSHNGEAPPAPPTPPPQGGTMAALLSVTLAHKAAEAYEFLVKRAKLNGQDKVPIDHPASILKPQFKSSSQYFVEYLRKVGVLKTWGDQEYLLNAEVTTAVRPGRMKAQPKSKRVSPSSAKPSPAKTPPTAPKSTEATPLEEALNFFAKHREIVTAVGLLKRTDRIGPVVVQAEQFLDQLVEHNLCLTDVQGTYAIIKRPPPKMKPR